MRGANHPRRRVDGTYCPDFQGVVETDDGAEVMFDWRGYGRAYPAGRRQIVVTGTHLSADERYRWLNDSRQRRPRERCARGPDDDGSTSSSSSPSSCGSRLMDEQRMRRMTASQRELEALHPTPDPTPCPHCGRTP